MGSRHYVVPADELDEAPKAMYRLKAQAAAIVRAFETGIVPHDPKEIIKRDAVARYPSVDDVLAFLQSGGFPAALDVREFKNIQDAGSAVDHWRTAALAAVGTEYSVFQAVAAPAIGLRPNQLVVWYSVQVNEAPLPVNRLIFRRTNATGAVMAEYDLEQLATQQRFFGFLSEPQIWNASTPYAINVMARIATGLFSRVILGNFLLEPASTTSTS